MFEYASRYYTLETATLTAPDGRVVSYSRRRFLPQGKDMRLLVDLTVAQDDRLDTITRRTIGDPQQFWRVCDINNAMNPFDLIEEPGETLHVPIPEVIA